MTFQRLIFLSILLIPLTAIAEISDISYERCWQSLPEHEDLVEMKDKAVAYMQRKGKNWFRNPTISERGATRDRQAVILYSFENELGTTYTHNLMYAVFDYQYIVFLGCRYSVRMIVPPTTNIVKALLGEEWLSKKILEALHSNPPPDVFEYENDLAYNQCWKNPSKFKLIQLASDISKSYKSEDRWVYYPEVIAHGRYMGSDDVTVLLSYKNKYGKEVRDDLIYQKFRTLFVFGECLNIGTVGGIADADMVSALLGEEWLQERLAEIAADKADEELLSNIRTDFSERATNDKEFDECWIQADYKSLSNTLLGKMSDGLQDMEWFKDPELLGIYDEPWGPWYFCSPWQQGCRSVGVIFSFGEDGNKLYGKFSYQRHRERRTDVYGWKEYCSYDLENWGEPGKKFLDRLELNADKEES